MHKLQDAHEREFINCDEDLLNTPDQIAIMLKLKIH